MANLPIRRVLILDRQPDDPQWLLAQIVLPSDVHAAQVDPDGSIDIAEGQFWAAEQIGSDVDFESLPPRSLGWHAMTAENTARLRELVRIMREVADRIAVEVAYIEEQDDNRRACLRLVDGKGGDTR